MPKEKRNSLPVAYFLLKITEFSVATGSHFVYNKTL